MKFKILSQGAFDGFCLLYSIMNAYKALVNPNQYATTFTADNSARWSKLIAISPSLENFSSGEGSDFGVDRSQTDVKLKHLFIKSCFDVLTEGTKKDLVTVPISIDELESVDYSKSIVIMCVSESMKFENGQPGDHWVAITDKNSDQNRFQIACSYTLHESGFTENIDPKSHRAFNNSIAFKDMNKSNVHKDYIVKVTRKDA